MGGALTKFSVFTGNKFENEKAWPRAHFTNAFYWSIITGPTRTSAVFTLNDDLERTERVGVTDGKNMRGNVRKKAIGNRPGKQCSGGWYASNILSGTECFRRIIRVDGIKYFRRKQDLRKRPVGKKYSVVEKDFIGKRYHGYYRCFT